MSHRQALSNRLKAARIRKGLSQEALADQLGKKQPFIARLEGGSANPQYETLVEVASVLGLKVVLEDLPSEDN